MPDEFPFDEPVITPGEEYSVAPAPEVMPVPKYSRRAQLATLATNGTSRAFNRNMANRLWAHMLGRGIVEPLDLHHSDNPPSHPELLEFLTEQLVAMKFDARAFLREVALSQTYQRSYELPSDTMSTASAATETLSAMEEELAKLKTTAAEGRKAAEEMLKSLDEAEKASLPGQERLTKVIGAVNAAQAELDKAMKPSKDAQMQAADQREAAKLLEEAIAKTKDAIAKLPDDKELASVAEKLQTRATQLAKDVEGLLKKAESLTAPIKPAQDALLVARKVAEPVQLEMNEWQKKIDDLRGRWVAASSRSHDSNLRVKYLQTRIGDVKLLSQLNSANVHLATLATSAKIEADREKLVAEQTANADRQVEVTQRLAQRFFASNLRPLAPEVLGWSIMQALGVVDQSRVASEIVVSKKLPLDPKTPLEPAKQRERDQALEQDLFARLAGSVGPFVNLFGAGDGQPQNEFFATVEQALFFGNGQVLRGWLTPTGQNLTGRLMKLDDPKALAEELYMSVLSRAPTAFERDEVARYVAARPTDKTSVVQELAWGLISSTEFRFNH